MFRSVNMGVEGNVPLGRRNIIILMTHVVKLVHKVTHILANKCFNIVIESKISNNPL